MLNILIVKDGEKMSKCLEADFLKENYNVNEAESGRTAIERMKNEAFDMVLMDEYRSDSDSFKTCREIRKISNIPLIILAPDTDEKNQILAYETGADDFIVKPVKEEILLAKINRIIERINGNQHNYKFIGLEIEKESRKINIDNKEMRFALKEYEVLLYLAENNGMVKSRDEILNYVWGYDSEASLRVIDNHIKKIRKKLGKYSYHIKTVTSMGYKFEG